MAMPGVITVKPKRERSWRKLQRKALSLAQETGRDYVLVIRRLEPPALAEDFRVAFSGEGPLPGLTTPVEAYRLYNDGRQVPVRGLEFLGVDRRAMRDIALAGRVGPAVGVMDSEPSRRRFNIGAVGGLPATWDVPPILINELELHGAGGGEQSVISPP